MKILYDAVSSEYIYPLSKKDISRVKELILPELLEKIRKIRFGCNTRTTQEGKTTQYGNSYEIRINFCLNNSKTLLLSDNNKYKDQIKEFGGVIDNKARLITWGMKNARRYALFLILHEIGHIVYCDKYLKGNMDTKGSLAEEQWCDNYAIDNLKLFDG